MQLTQQPPVPMDEDELLLQPESSSGAVAELTMEQEDELLLQADERMEPASVESMDVSCIFSLV